MNQGEIHALREAAERAWGDDTRHQAYHGHPLKAAGQCYVTSKWLQSRLGGHVGQKDGHYFWVSPGQRHVLDLTGDQFASRPEDPSLEGLRLDEDDTGLQLDPEQQTWRSGPALYKSATHPLYEDYSLVDDQPNHRADRFTRRADREFDNLGSRTSKLALDYAGDAFPGQEPEATEMANQRYWHDEPGLQAQDEEYKFVYAQGSLEVSPVHDHDELAGHANLAPDHSGPMAVGYIALRDGRATWEVETNVSPNALTRVFKDYGKQVGWDWGGMTDIEGEPVGTGSAFAPKGSSYPFKWIKDRLYIAPSGTPKQLVEAAISEGATEKDLQMMLAGRIQLTPAAPSKLSFDHYQKPGNKPYISEPLQTTNKPYRAKASRDWDLSEKPLQMRVSLNFRPRYLMPLTGQLIAFKQALLDYADDQKLLLIGGNDNVIKTIEDLELENVYSPEQNQQEQPFFPDASDAGVFRCPKCDQLLPNRNEYERHLPNCEPREDGQFPELDTNSPAPFQPHFTPMQPEVQPILGSREARRVDGFPLREKLFDLEGAQHYVAYQYGCPVGVASVRDDELILLHAVQQPKKVAMSLVSYIKRHVPCLDLTKHGQFGGVSYNNPEVENLISKWAQSPAGPAQPGATETQQPAEGDIPFIYDVQEDGVFVGHPGSKTSDIPGRFTPGGIVEGTYENGKVILRSLTNMPYTVRHLVELWYYEHPELDVKSVVLQDDDGKETKLAATADPSSIGPYISVLVAADQAAHAAQNALQQAGGRVFAVGGAVRDAVLGEAPKDIDLMVTGLEPRQVRETLDALPGQVALTGNNFGVFRYRQGPDEVEVALPRRERSVGAGHKDFDVQVDPSMAPEEDLYRRDFTANAMAVDLATQQLIDPYGGSTDIANKKLRVLNEHSISDDPLRAMRALVAHGRHGLDPDEATRAQMVAQGPQIQHLPAERIMMELDKIMASADPAGALILAHGTGLLKFILPEVDAAFGFDQNNPHHEHELGEHLASVLKRLSKISDDPDVRLAALLHDVGKPASAWTDPETGTNHYYEGPDGQGANHEEVGADMARERLNQLRYPNERVDRITDLVAHHMYPPFSTLKGARKFVNRVGPHAEDLMDIREADQEGKGYGREPDVNQQRQLVQQVREVQAPTDVSMLAINGSDLIDAGITPGPQMGEILSALVQAVVDDPSLNSRASLIDLARRINEGQSRMSRLRQPA
jgi:tRNA nucleotidyltransferase (CCA-adding enzyme)